MKPNMGEILEWGIVMHAPYGYVAVGLNGDQCVRTSPIVKMEDNGDGYDIETQNSRYQLRGPSNDAGARQLYKWRTGRDPGEFST